MKTTDPLLQYLVGKLTSGRFILTLIGGAAFIIVVSTNNFPHEATAAILTAIFMSYFNRTRNGGK